MERTDIDGVPVLWHDVAAPFNAVLTFGCGAQDERFRTIGVTHMIEHLAMGTLPRLHHGHNASVDLDTTQFFAEGTPEQIVEFLRRVCEALGDLPVRRLAQEAGVLHAEGGHSTHPTAAALLAERYGTAGPGLAWYSGPGYDRITADHVREHAARFFVRGNAALMLTGPPPPGLTLPLPDGPRPDRAPATRRPPADGPRWVDADVPAVGIALSSRYRDPAATLAQWVLVERLTRIARHEHGLSYDVGQESHAVGDVTERFVWLDARESRAAEVAGLLWRAVLDLAESGPTADELAEELASLRAEHGHPFAAGAEVATAVAELIAGRTHLPPAEVLATLETVTPADVAAYVAEAARTALVVVPCDVAPELEYRGAPVPRARCASDGDALPQGQVYRPSLVNRTRFRAARQLAASVHADGVALRDSDGDVHTVRFDEVVGVLEDGDVRVLFGRNGCHVPLDPDVLVGVGAAIRAIDERVPAALRYRPSQLDR